MATEVAISTDRVQKFVDDLEAEKTALSTCTQLFTTLSNHFKSLEESLSLRAKSVESKLQSLESTSRQTLQSLSQREDSIPQRESEAVDGVRERKQAAIAAIEKLVPKDAGLSENLRSLAMRMDSLGLVKLIVSKRKEPGSFRAELTDAINVAIDPPKLVLDAVEEFLENKTARTGIMDKRWAVALLVQALFPDMKPSSSMNLGDENVDSGPKFAKSVVERAWRVLEMWKEQMGQGGEGSDFGKFGPVEAVMFLQMVVGFGLKSRFDEEFLKKMVLEFSSRRDIAKLAPCLGFGEKLADIIDELVRMSKEIDAVYFATESGLTERFPPASLLKSFLKNSRKNATDALKKGNNSAVASEESSNIELNAIRAVVKCVEDQKLESVFTLDAMKKRANVLEKAKSERRKSSGSAPSSSKLSGKRGHSSGGGKGSGPPIRPAKVAKLSYHPSFARRTPAPVPAPPPRQPSPAARYSLARYGYPGHDAFEVNGGNPYTPTSYGVAHNRNAAGISQQQYSPIVGSPTGAYLPPLHGEQTSYDYASAGQQAYHPTNPSYTQ
ncbi:hypothetical protein CDL15_Pgr012553 [Punica granatum]|uniref:FRIGIDA-like protein n=1 Tax=Punica granatum TaxID=22663 RepID=A0A218XZ47_PUNGR|nr:hypothetical protein CDL15_Pgr012553 [Punica granatum]